MGDFLTLDDVVISGKGGCTGNGGGIRTDGGVITITNSTITANCADTTGGGILNFSDGVITIISSAISLNSSSTLSGGGIFSGNNTTMTLTNTNILSNTAATSGGGVVAANGASLIFYGVTLQGNSALTDSGGGIYIKSSVLTLTYSTVSGNSTAQYGGGIFVDLSTANLNNTTVTNNTADSDSNGSGDGGGISRWGIPTINLKNTILAGNIDTGGQAPDCDATLTTQGYNLLGKNGGCTGLTNGVSGDIVGTNTSPVNALLAPLANNGGLTRTHLLLPGSPAINAGNPAAPGSGGNACASTDQRGVTRPIDGRCDIGAVEYETLLIKLFLPLVVR